MDLEKNFKNPNTSRCKQIWYLFKAPNIKSPYIHLFSVMDVSAGCIHHLSGYSFGLVKFPNKPV